VLDVSLVALEVYRADGPLVVESGDYERVGVHGGDAGAAE